MKVADEIHLNRKKVEHCVACGNGWGTCNKTGECALRDDFAELYERLVSAVYWSDLTECMKAFIDRLRRCKATHNHYLAEKRCMLVACAGERYAAALKNGFNMYY